MFALLPSDEDAEQPKTTLKLENLRTVFLGDPSLPAALALHNLLPLSTIKSLKTSIVDNLGRRCIVPTDMTEKQALAILKASLHPASIMQG